MKARGFHDTTSILQHTPQTTSLSQPCATLLLSELVGDGQDRRLLQSVMADSVLCCLTICACRLLPPATQGMPVRQPSDSSRRMVTRVLTGSWSPLTVPPGALPGLYVSPAQPMKSSSLRAACAPQVGAATSRQTAKTRRCRIAGQQQVGVRIVRAADQFGQLWALLEQAFVAVEAG